MRIRFTRTGKKKQPNFRIVVAEHSSPVKGKYIEILGNYQPSTEAKAVTFKKDRIEYWISVGAKPTDSVAALLKKEGLSSMDKFIIKSRNLSRKKKKASPEDTQPAAAAAPAPTETPTEESVAPESTPEASE